MSRFVNCATKVDNKEKVAGEALFTDDYILEDCLIAMTVRASVTKGKILSIKYPSMPEGYYVVDKEDVVKENVVNMISSDWPAFCTGQVNYLGEPIAIIVGKDKEIINELISKVEIEYKEEQPIFDYSKSIIHKGFNKGNFEEAIKDSVKTFKETFETGYQEQAYLETQSVLCHLEGKDKYVVIGSMQCPYYIKKALMRTLGVGEDKVRVIQPAVGGAFGGKEDYPSVMACQLATAVHKIGKPVKMIYDREEDINYTTKRHPSTTELEAYVNKDNKIVAIKAKVSLDGGAYIGMSSVVLSRALIAITNAYTIDNLQVEGDVYETNTVPTGAFRGFGSPQTIFAIEMFMHHIAFDLGIEPLELRMKHLVKKGDVTSTSGTFHDPIILDQLISRAMEMSDYKRKLEEYRKPNSFKGIGMSFFLHGCGFTGSGETDKIKAKVKLIKDENNHVHVYAASVDMGQGNRTTLKKIVEINLGLKPEEVTFNGPDTDLVPDSGPTAASRTIIIVGFLMEKAAKKLKAQWKDNIKQEVIENYVGPDYIHFDEATLQGDAYPSYSWGVNVVEVEVSPITYQVTLKGIWSTYDVGKCIDERIMQGQADGGVVQAVGYGYLENMVHKNGKIMQKNLTDYIIPTIEDVPLIENEFIDNPFIYGPSGAKGAGELVFVGGAPAVALAIEEAIKVKVNKIPATPEYIMEVMKNGKN